LSFFDEADEPRTPSRARRTPSGGGSSSRRPPTDQQTLLVRRLIAAGAVVVVLVLLVVLVQSCVGSRREQALKDYNRDVRTLVEQSQRAVATPLFETLRGAAARSDPTQVQESINQLRQAADEQLDQARNLDAPDEMSEAQRDLELVLSLRRDGVAEIADNIQQAIGTSPGAGQAVDAIAAQMQAFNASDVVYSQRVAPLILKGLRDDGISASYDGSAGEQVQPYSNFLSGAAFGLMSPTNVARELGTSSASADDTGEPAPGLHGHQIDSVSVNGVDLEAGGSATVPAASPTSFDVNFTNGGDHDEQNVRVSVEISGSGAPLRAETVVPQSVAGESTTATVELDDDPPTGGPVTITVEVAAVPGEESTDNNRATYTALFE
jgi:hypothetical protein